MVIMDEKKECPGSPRDISKKMCPRAARENAKKNPDNKPWKTAHTGLRFHFDRKKLVTHEFSFNSVSKTEKVTRCRSREKSVEKESSTESTKTTGSKEIKVLMDTLKISKSEECSTREKSPLRKEIPKSPVVERLTSKKACTRCSRCSRSPKVETADIKPLKVAKNHDQSLKSTKKENTVKTVKIEAPQSPKTCKKQCSKLAKLVEEPQEKTLKPKSILVHTEKSSQDNNEKSSSKNSELNTPPLSPKTSTCKKQCSKLAKLLSEPHEKSLNAKSTSAHTEKSASRDNEKSDASKTAERIPSGIEKPKSGKSNCENEKRVEFAWPVSGKPENMISSSDVAITNDKGNSELLNGSESPVPSHTVACLLNGRHDEHVCDPHAGLESPDEAKRELESMKTPSKIPRKTHGSAGMKSDANLNKEMISQTLIEL